MITPLQYGLRIVEQGGDIARDFHRWLQLIARAISSTYVADQAPQQNTVIGDGQFGIHAKRMTLGANIRLTISGSGRLVICG